MTADPYATATLVGFALDTASADVPPAAIRAARRVLFDTIGCSIGGFDTEIGRHFVAVASERGGRPEATLLVSGAQLPLAAVAYVHSELANAMDADETLMHRAHFANVIAMPALAAAELADSSATELLAAIALGFDVAARVGRALPIYDVGDAGAIRFHQVSGHSYAVFGTVAAVGRLLGLQREQLASALGVAFMSAPVHTPWVVFPRGIARPMSKYAMYGAIAEAAINGVRLAARGFTGHHRVLDPDYEFWTALGSPGCDYDAMLSDLGRRWAVTETSFKLYPFGRQANIVIDLALALAAEHALALDDIERLTIRMPPSSVTAELSGAMRTRTQLDASFDLRYALAAALAGITPGPRWLDAANWSDPRLVSFGDRVAVEAQPGWRGVIEEQIRSEGTFRRIPTEVEIAARGERFVAGAEYARGDPWTAETNLADEELAAKFVEFTRMPLGEVRSADAARALLELDGDVPVAGVLGQLVSPAAKACG